MTFRLLHTSDWHLGRRLYGRSRDREQGAFLRWLTAVLEREAVDLLVVSGDIFDTTTPSHRSQTLYYDFLYRAARSACRHIVVVGGNHDSPALLEAPKALLAQLNVHVVGQAAAEIADEVLVLTDNDGVAEAIVCAVPYLRDRDVRTSDSGESAADKQRLLLEGIADHYARVLAEARERRERLKTDLPDGHLPIIVTGHLFAAGGKTQAEDGVRELYVGSLVRVDAATFGAGLDYLALGHLHSAQRVAGMDHLRYSGAPFALGFAEAGHLKKVLLGEFSAAGRQVREIEIPGFQALERIQGDLPAIEAQLDKRVAEDRPLWVEVVYTGQTLRSDLSDRLPPLVAQSPVEILRIRNRRRSAQLLGRAEREEDLEDLHPSEVFARCLEAHEIEAAERPALTTLFEEVVHDLREAPTDGGPDTA